MDFYSLWHNLPSYTMEYSVCLFRLHRLSRAYYARGFVGQDGLCIATSIEALVSGIGNKVFFLDSSHF